MIEFLWNVPIFFFEIALNLLFWGSIIAVLVWIFKEGFLRYYEEWQKNKKVEEKEETPEDYII